MSLVNQAVLQEAALQLLASSTVSRYAREASRLAKESGLVRTVASDSLKASEAVVRLVGSLKAVDAAVDRTVEEFEAALLLCALSRSEAPEAVAMVRGLTAKGATTSPWIAALAARLVALGPVAEGELSPIHAALSKVLDGKVVHVEAAPDTEDVSEQGAFPRRQRAA